MRTQDFEPTALQEVVATEAADDEDDGAGGIETGFGDGGEGGVGCLGLMGGREEDGVSDRCLKAGRKGGRKREQ